jgi:hypothetical protein
VKILDQEVSKREYALLDRIMRRHFASVRVDAFSEAARVNCEGLVTKGILAREDCGELMGLHYLVPPPVIGAYLLQRGAST